VGAFVYWLRFVWHWQHSTDNIVTFENTTSINLNSLLCVILFCPFLINRSGIFERYNVVSVRQIGVVKRTQLNFFALASRNNLPKLIPVHWLLLNLLSTLVLSLMNTFLWPNICSLSILLLSYLWTSVYSSSSWLQTASTIATSTVHSNLNYCNSLYYNLPQSQMKKTPEHPELSCWCCHQNAKIFSHHCCAVISTLARKKRTHQINSFL